VNSKTDSHQYAEMQGIFITTKNLRKKNIKKFLLFFYQNFKKKSENIQ